MKGSTGFHNFTILLNFAMNDEITQSKQVLNEDNNVREET